MTNTYLITSFIKDVCIILLCFLILGYISGRIEHKFNPPTTSIKKQSGSHSCIKGVEVYLDAHNIYRM